MHGETVKVGDSRMAFNDEILIYGLNFSLELPSIGKYTGDMASLAGLSQPFSAGDDGAAIIPLMAV